MKKTKFLYKLQKKLKHKLSADQVHEVVNYYEEMIDDHMEEGMHEDDAVRSCGDIDDIINETTNNYPKHHEKNTLPRTEKKHHSAFSIVMLVLGFPLWFPLLMAFVGVLLSIFVVGWLVILAIFISAIAFLIGGVAYAVALFFNIGLGTGFILLNAGIALVGLGLFLPCLFLSTKMAKGYGKGSLSVLKRSFAIFKGGR